MRSPSSPSHLLHVTVGRLRQKLEDHTRKPQYILTRRGIGYSLPTGQKTGTYAVGLD